jgi:hypothetical protein
VRHEFAAGHGSAERDKELADISGSYFHPPGALLVNQFGFGIFPEHGFLPDFGGPFYSHRYRDLVAEFTENFGGQVS